MSSANKLQTALDTKKMADAKAFVSAATAELAEGGDGAVATCGAIKTGVASKDVVALTASIAEDQPLLTALLHAAADKKSNDLCAAAADALVTIAMAAHDCVVAKALVPAALEALDPKERWQTQVACERARKAF